MKIKKPYKVIELKSNCYETGSSTNNKLEN
jgi:hypothetical protein